MLLMVNRLLMPQEIEAYFVLPALRRDLAMSMKANGLAQKEIARLLGVTEPAVSQYLSAKRAKEVTFSKTVHRKISEAAGKITDAHSLIEQMQRLLSVVRDDNVVCKIHKNMGFGECNVDFCLGKKRIVRIGE